MNLDGQRKFNRPASMKHMSIIQFKKNNTQTSVMDLTFSMAKAHGNISRRLVNSIGG